MTLSPQRRRFAVAVLVGATLVLIVLAARRVPELAANASLVPVDHPWMRLDREISAQFGFENPVVWVIAAREGTIWNREHLQHVHALTRAVLKIPGVVPTDVISLGSPNLREVEVTETGMRPVYLMAEVPTAPEQLEALRHRVETDPNYRGTLVSMDGRAAMVVANFRADADVGRVAGEARGLQAAHRDTRTDVYVAGAPLVRTMQVRPDRWHLVGAAATTVAAAAVVCAGLGALSALRCALAALLAIVWTGAGLAAFGGAQLPWSAYAMPYAAALAGGAAALARDRLEWPGRLALGAALAGGFVIMSAMLDTPVRALTTAGAVGSLLAVLASHVAASPHGAAAPAADYGARPAGRRSEWLLRLAGVGLIITGGVGIPQLDTSLGLAGYGARYLPGTEAANLRTIARYFPPPTALAVRVRGAPSFVTSPAVLGNFDNLVGSVRADPAVVSAMSLADLVKLVHRAFNGNDPAFAVIPDDEGLIARYLALAYAPGFRRFVDRSLASAAIWIYVVNDDPSVLRRVLAQVQTQVRAHPLANAEVDLIGGDGAGVLLMAGTLRSLEQAIGAWLVSAPLLLAVFCGWRTGVRAALGGAAAVAVMAGACGWLGVPLDLLSLPLLLAIVAAATGWAALSASLDATRLQPLGLGLALAAAPAVLSTYAGAALLGSALLPLAVVACVFPRRNGSAGSR